MRVTEVAELILTKRLRAEPRRLPEAKGFSALAAPTTGRAARTIAVAFNGPCPL